jgi:hypothetical protein
MSPLRISGRKVFIVEVSNGIIERDTTPVEFACPEHAYLFTQFRAYPEAWLRRYLVEEMELDPPATSDSEVYERTYTGFYAMQRLAESGPMCEVHPFVMLADNPGVFVRMDSHHTKVFVP